MEKDKNALPAGVTQEQVDKWKTEHGEVYVLTSEDEADALAIVVRKPDRNHLSRFAQGAMKDTLKALHNLAVDTVLYPAPAVLNKLFTEKPGLVIPLGGELQNIAGTNANFTARKL